MRKVSCIVFSVIVSVTAVVSHARNALLKSDTALYEDVVAKSGAKARGHNELGLAYVKAGLTDMAVEELLTAININPYFAAAYNNLGNAYFVAGRLDYAIDTYRMTIGMRPGDVNTHFNLAMAYKRKGMRKEAVLELNEVLRLDPGDEQAKMQLLALGQ